MREYVLVLGLGSMGKRRVGNLQKIGIENIIGVDVREDRRNETFDMYRIDVYPNVDEVFEKYKIKALIISLPPDIHHIYINKSIELEIPCFVEASVLDTDFKSMITKSSQQNVLVAPSCTMYFHPAIQRIAQIIKSGDLGTITNFLYHSGQYLPDWHTYEDVKDFYVSNKETSGGREIVPFELTWITLVLGFPNRVASFYKGSKKIKGAESIDDTYNILMDYGNSIFNLTVDVISRKATRRLIINGIQKQLYWNWDENEIKIYNPKSEQWSKLPYQVDSARPGYNANITEKMYEDEMVAFFKAVQNEDSFPNTLKHDYQVLQTLYSAERSDNNNIIESL